MVVSCHDMTVLCLETIVSCLDTKGFYWMLLMSIWVYRVYSIISLNNIIGQAKANQ